MSLCCGSMSAIGQTHSIPLNTPYNRPLYSCLYNSLSGVETIAHVGNSAVLILRLRDLTCLRCGSGCGLEEVDAGGFGV